MLLDVSESQLVLIDYQARLMPAMADAAGALANAARLAEAAQLLEVPVWGTEQNPSKLGPLPPELRERCQRVMAKMEFSACAEGLSEWLRPPVVARAPQGNARSLPRHLQKPQSDQPGGRGMIVVAGCETHICLLQTALDLLDDEFDVWVVTDACSSSTDRNRDAAFDRLAGAGAELVTTEMVLFEWLGGAENPLFKQVQALIK